MSMQQGMDDSGGIDFVLVNTMGTNPDGTSRQDVLASCDEQTPLFIGRHNEGLGILVRRYAKKPSFAWIGDFPIEVVNEYRKLIDADWTFRITARELVRNGPTLGLRVRGYFVPPVVPPPGQEESFYDLT